MLWHIFRKDCRLLWPIALCVAGANISYRTLFAWLSFSQEGRLTPIVNMLTVFSLMGTAILIAMVVQLDALPGVRQDWLVRPIRRSDLFLSKLLFAITIVQGPIFLAETMTCLANGFSASQSIAAAFDRSIYLFLAFDLPVLAFATLTRTLVEAIGAALGATLLFAIIQTLRQFGPVTGVMFTPLEWVIDSTQVIVGVLGAAAIIALQYSLRKTIPARWSAFGIGLMWVAAQLLPWQTAFAIQRRFAPAPAAADRVNVTFDASIGKFRAEPGVNYNELLRRAGMRGQYADLFLPVRISGVRDDEMLRPDLSRIRITTASGTVFNLERGGALQRIPQLKAGGHQLIWVPQEIYQRIQDDPVKLEIGYLMTLLQGTPAHSMPAVEGDEHTPDAGRCRTGVNVAGTAFQWRCSKPGVAPACFSVFLENPKTGNRGPERSDCGDYMPYEGASLFQDSMRRFGLILPYRDPTGFAKFPVDGSQLHEARVIFRVFQPEAHFERKVFIDNVRLSDWLVE